MLSKTWPHEHASYWKTFVSPWILFVTIHLVHHFSHHSNSIIQRWSQRPWGTVVNVEWYNFDDWFALNSTYISQIHDWKMFTLPWILPLPLQRFTPKCFFSVTFWHWFVFKIVLYSKYNPQIHKCHRPQVFSQWSFSKNFRPTHKPHCNQIDATTTNTWPPN
jgi:hypothetical protein